MDFTIRLRTQKSCLLVRNVAQGACFNINADQLEMIVLNNFLELIIVALPDLTTSFAPEGWLYSGEVACTTWPVFICHSIGIPTAVHIATAQGIDCLRKILGFCNFLRDLIRATDSSILHLFRIRIFLNDC